MGNELERLINHQALPNRERMKNPDIIAEIARITHIDFEHPRTSIWPNPPP